MKSCGIVTVLRSKSLPVATDIKDTNEHSGFGLEKFEMLGSLKGPFSGSCRVQRVGGGTRLTRYFCRKLVKIANLWLPTNAEVNCR